MKANHLLFVCIVLGLILVGAESRAATILDQQDAAKALTIRNLNATASQVSGEIVNQTPHTIRDVELFVQYHWLWKNEYKPGRESPGRTDLVKIPQEIKPGGSVTFRHMVDPPLPSRQDGSFEPEVTIAGFTTIIPGVDMTSR
jgi:hypothetical protein